MARYTKDPKVLEVNMKKHLKNVSEETLDKLVVLVHTELVNTTPVRTGKARGSWQIEDISPGFKKIVSRGVMYMKRLNDGWSLQAPKGFIQDAIRKGKLYIRR